MKRKPLFEIANALGAECNVETLVTGFAIDSRLIERGELFFALPGEKVHGEEYLREASARGAVGAVVSEGFKGDTFGLNLIRVESVFDSLQGLAKEWMRKRDVTVIGVTGSMGKTTTKEYIAHLLGAKYDVAKSPGNYNTQRTVPLNVLNLEGEVMVLEMAMSQRGGIRKLVEIAPPYLSVVTRIAPAGIDGLEGGLEEVARAKSEIFGHPKTRHGVMSEQAAGYRQVMFAGTCQKWVYGEGLEDAPEFDLSHLPGHLRENALGAMTVARLMGLSWEEICGRLKTLPKADNRFEVIEKRGVTFVCDAYNANPDSMRAAIENLPKGERRIALLGSMDGLGKKSGEYHRDVGKVAKEHLDHLFCLGDEAKEILKGYGKEGSHFECKDAVRDALFSFVKPGDVVLLKGANRHRLKEVMEG